ncbi:MAG: magnesium/cobalt transporter CorA [Nocardioidaceae bacterium]
MIVDCAVYDEGARRDGRLPIEDACEAGREEGAFVWIALHEPTGAELDALRREFNLHELAVEDAMEAHQRPKLELYDDMLFVVVKTAHYVDHVEVVEHGELLIFLGASYVITVLHSDEPSLRNLRAELEQEPEALRRGPSAILHAILDRVVDDYQPAIDGLAVDIEEVESEVFSESRSNPVERIYKLKREVLEFHRAAAPLIEPVERLARGHVGLLHPEIRAYMRDVDDHLIRVREQLDAERDLLTSILEANLTQVSVRQNEDVRRISAWVAIIAVPTMIAGIYGMNFEHMPELRSSFGYPAALAMMLVACTLLYRFFKRSGWL